MVDHAVRERLATSTLAEIRSETEGLGDRQVSLDCEHGCSRALLLAEDLTTTLVEHRVDTADRVLGTLDLD